MRSRSRWLRWLLRNEVMREAPAKSLLFAGAAALGAGDDAHAIELLEDAVALSQRLGLEPLREWRGRFWRDGREWPSAVQCEVVSPTGRAESQPPGCSIQAM